MAKGLVSGGETEMTRKKQQNILCQICKRQQRPNEVLPGELIREPVVKTIRKTHPDWSPDGFICISDLNDFRGKYVRDVLETEKGELSTSEEQVMTSLKEYELLSKNVNIEFDQQLTLGERLADKIAEFGGSWGFILCFAGCFLLWIAINSIILIWKPFDPYPFILLNLFLSCLAAIQAPIIMMSQNRQGAKDRLRSQHDYSVNLKAELEIRHLHEKLDHLLMNQWQRLLEIQEIQTELMEELARKTPRRRSG
jgi:uncharacterized membrane protein